MKWELEYEMGIGIWNVNWNMECKLEYGM